VTPLAIPVPPQLEAVVGYPGDARWFCLCWTCMGDTVLYDDARASGTGHGWGYLGWTRHRAVAPLLRDADLGSSEQDGTQRLVIDRQERRAFLADAAEARAFLREQWPAEEPVELTTEQWQEVVEEIRQRMLARPLPSMGDLMEQMRQHSALVGEMIRSLDAIQAEQAGG
jgi:hypothetical protein